MADARKCCGNCKWWMSGEEVGDYGICMNEIVMDSWDSSRRNGVMQVLGDDLCGEHAPAGGKDGGE